MEVEELALLWRCGCEEEWLWRWREACDSVWLCRDATASVLGRVAIVSKLGGAAVEHPLQFVTHPQVLAVASTVPLPYQCTSQSTPRGSQRDPASGLSTLPESRQVYTHSSSLYLSLASLTMP